MSAERLDLLCVGYLADAQVLRVDHYPPANRGTTVNDRCRSVADDVPIVALLAVQQGLAAAHRLTLPLQTISSPHGVPR